MECNFCYRPLRILQNERRFLCLFHELYLEADCFSIFTLRSEGGHYVLKCMGWKLMGRELWAGFYCWETYGPVLGNLWACVGKLIGQC
jgi:hypothetical protein